jgi:phosphoribosylformimino-5-aminoimidazole carboxamide ribotide isomerase
MMIIPAVDIKDGKCVRLLQGRMDAETVFSDDPSAMAEQWENQGAELLHVVDLNGAVEKKPHNLPSIERIIQRIGIPVQIGGGIRDIETIHAYFDIGLSRVVIGTEAIRNPELVHEACKKYPGRIVVGIDARKGRVAIEGWTQTTDVLAVDLAKQFEDFGVAAINFTDIHRDGMQTGPNIEETKQLAEAVSIPIVASGGVSTLEDIRNMLPLSKSGVVGVITGKALYSGTLDLKEAIRLAKSV